MPLKGSAAVKSSFSWTDAVAVDLRPMLIVLTSNKHAVVLLAPKRLHVFANLRHKGDC